MDVSVETMVDEFLAGLDLPETATTQQVNPTTPVHQTFRDYSHQLPGETVAYRHTTMGAQGSFAQAERLARKGLLIILEWEPVLNDRRDIEMALGFVEVGPCTMVWPDINNLGSAANRTAYLRFGQPADAVAAAKALETARSIGGPVRGRIAKVDDFLPENDDDEDGRRQVAVDDNGSPIVRRRIGGTRIAPIFEQQPSDSGDDGSDGDDEDSGSDYDSEGDYDSDDEKRWGKFRILNEASLRSDPASRILWPAATSAAKARSGFSPDDPFTNSPVYVPNSPVYVPNSPVTNFSAPPPPPAAPAHDRWYSRSYSPVRSPLPPVQSPVGSPVNNWLSLDSKDPWDEYEELIRLWKQDNSLVADDDDYYLEEQRQEEGSFFRAAYFPTLEDFQDTMPN